MNISSVPSGEMITKASPGEALPSQSKPPMMQKKLQGLKNRVVTKLDTLQQRLGSDSRVGAHMEQLIQILGGRAKDAVNTEDTSPAPATRQPKAIEGKPFVSPAPDGQPVSPTPETQSPPETEELYDMAEQENSYLERNRYRKDDTTGKEEGYKELDARYNDVRTEAQYVLSQLEEKANEMDIPAISDEAQLYPLETPEQEIPVYLKTLAREQVLRAFHVESLTPQEGGQLTSEQQKALSVLTMSERYIDLAFQAKAEGSLAKGEVSSDFPKHLARLVRENILKLSYQDYIAAANTLGDHGVRHLVDHNISVTEKVARALGERGVEVTAADRLIMHQIMIDHDLGYAMAPVDEQIQQGNMSADRGHNVLAAKFLRERAARMDDPLASLFTSEQIALLHEGILTHDSSEINFSVNDGSPTARKENLLSMIHLADNTHAFETKLPELLYGFPDTLATMRLMKTAAEVGDTESLQVLKADLIGKIDNNSAFSDEEKGALKRAAEGLSGSSYKFTVGRICGNNPEFTIDGNGKVTISVEESAIHQEAMRIYGQESLDQLMKFMADLSGRSKAEVKQIVASNAGEFDAGKLLIKAVKSHEGAETDYQRRVREIIEDEDMQEFVFGQGLHGGDAFDADRQAVLEAKLQKTGSLTSQEEESLEAIKKERGERLHAYMNKKGI